MRRYAILVVLVSSVCCVGSWLRGATLVVDLKGGADYVEIQPAIDAAAGGDTVLVKPGEYVIAEPIDFNRLHDPANPASPPVKNIVVKSEGGADATTIRMGETPADPNGASVVIFKNGEGVESRLEDLTLTGGKGTWDPFWDSLGGGVCCYFSSPTLTNCTISGNSADWGGGVSCEEGSSPTLTNCTISGNSAGLAGGGVYCRSISSPTLTSCTISGNLAGSAGGGVCCGSDSSPTLTNCTISGNSAYEGGGMLCGLDSSPTLKSCTISGNSADWGGGLYCLESSPTLINCIVFLNSPESACGALSSCLTDQDPLFVDPGGWVDCVSPDDPLCVAYQWDEVTGEPTAWHRWVFDYHLQPGSPAIDAGTSSGAPSTDMDGHGRPCGAGVDIGAYESGQCPAPTERLRRGDSDGSGAMNLTDSIVVLNHLFLGGEPPVCLDAADSDDSGALDITDAIYGLNFLFLGGPAPRAPFAACGIDPTIDGLGCAGPGDCG